MMEYVFEGGSLDGQRMDTDGTHIVRVPLRRPVNVVRMVRGLERQLALDYEDYIRSGDVYRHEGLIGDAQAEMDVAVEYARLPEARREVRYQLRRYLQGLAEDKVVDRIVWRVAYDRSQWRLRVKALVGGRRVERGLQERSERRPT